MKKLLNIIILLFCLISMFSCKPEKVEQKIMTGTIVSYKSHTVLSDECLIKCDNNTFYTLQDDQIDGIYAKYLFEHKIHIKLIFNEYPNYLDLIKVEQIK